MTRLPSQPVRVPSRQPPRVYVQVSARTQSPPLPINEPLVVKRLWEGVTGGTTTEMVVGSTPRQRSKIFKNKRVFVTDYLYSTGEWGQSASFLCLHPSLKA